MSLSNRQCRNEAHSKHHYIYYIKWYVTTQQSTDCSMMGTQQSSSWCVVLYFQCIDDDDRVTTMTRWQQQQTMRYDNDIQNSIQKNNTIEPNRRWWYIQYWLLRTDTHHQYLCTQIEHHQQKNHINEESWISTGGSQYRLPKQREDGQEGAHSFCRRWKWNCRYLVGDILYIMLCFEYDEQQHLYFL